jgi:hypothetical protein
MLAMTEFIKLQILAHLSFTGVVITPTAAMEVLLELHLFVMIGARLRQGCRLKCTQQ